MSYRDTTHLPPKLQAAYGRSLAEKNHVSLEDAYKAQLARSGESPTMARSGATDSLPGVLPPSTSFDTPGASPGRTEGRYPLTLPVPPVLNRMYRTSVNSRTGALMVTKTQAARQYRRDVEHLVTVYRMLEGGEVITGDCALTVRWYRGRKAGDVDGILKGLLDSLEGLIYVNDSQIVELHIYRLEDKTNARVEVEVSARNPCSCPPGWHDSNDNGEPINKGHML